MKPARNIVFAALLLMPAICLPQWSAGPEIGMNLLPMEKTELGRDYRTGLHAGIALDYRLHPNMSISSGLFIEQKVKMFGSATNNSLLNQFTGLFNLIGVDYSLVDSLVNLAGVNDTMYEKTRGVHSQYYLELPLMAAFHYKNLNFCIGPYAGVLISARQKSESVTTIPFLQAFQLESIDTTGLLSMLLPPAEMTEYQESESRDHLSVADFGLTAGIGYTMKNLKFNLYYSYGLLDYRKDRAGAPKSAYRAFRFSVCYMFGLEGLFSNQPSHTAIVSSAR